MAAEYILVRIKCPEHLAEMLMAEMSMAGFDSFLHTDSGFQASLLSGDFDSKELESIIRRYGGGKTIEYTTESLDDQNWNELWERNFEPVVIGDRCLIRASFHQTGRSFPYEIVINPKMSFGTGHHATTRLMIETQLETAHNSKTVLDVGCGTGILSILAEKLGAREVRGIDIDQWAYQNALENLAENNCTITRISFGGMDELEGSGQFDILLANINRQIIVQEMEKISSHTVDKGLLICSGFYRADMKIILDEANRNKLFLRSEKSLSDWSALVFQKKSN